MTTRRVALGCLVAALGCRNAQDEKAYFPPTIVASGAHLASPAGPCLSRSAVPRDAQMLITGAGVGLPLSSAFTELSLSHDRGVSFEDHRGWTIAGRGSLSYRVIPIATLRRDSLRDSVQREATDVRVCDTTVDGHQIHIFSYVLPAGFIGPGPADEVHAWFPADEGRMVSLVAQGERGLRDSVLALLRGVRIGLPPSHAEFPHEPPPVPAALSPDSVPVGDSIAYRGHYAFADRSDLADTVVRLAFYSTRAADVVHIERSNGDSLEVVARLILPPSVRVDTVAVLTVCKVGGVANPEVFGFYPIIPFDSAIVGHPRLAWRANRTALRFEPVAPASVICEPADDGGNDGTGAA